MQEVVYVKTPKGLEEMTSRRYRLGMKERQALIMLNGKRTLAEVAGTLPPLESQPILDKLVAEGFIVPLKAPAGVSAAPVAAPAAAGGNKAAPPMPSPANDQQRFEMAGNFMTNTLNAFVGMASSSLAQRIESATTLDELRPLYQPWQEAIGLSAKGRKELPTLESRLAALLS